MLHAVQLSGKLVYRCNWIECMIGKSSLYTFTVVIVLSVYCSCLQQLVDVVMSPSVITCMRRQLSQRDEELQQVHIVLKHTCDVSAVTEMMLTFCCGLK